MEELTLKMSYYLEIACPGWWKHLGEIICKALASLTQVYDQLKLMTPIQNEWYVYTLASLPKRKGSLSSPYCLVKKQMHHFLHVCVSDVVAARFGVL